MLRYPNFALSPGAAMPGLFSCCEDMGIRRVGVAVVEVTTPDGSRELWAAATEHSKAVAAVQRLLPPGYVAKLSNLKYRRSSRVKGFHYGEVRKVEP
jgi:hypothetical protein